MNENKKNIEKFVSLFNKLNNVNLLHENLSITYNQGMSENTLMSIYEQLEGIDAEYINDPAFNQAKESLRNVLTKYFGIEFGDEDKKLTNMLLGFKEQV